MKIVVKDANVLIDLDLSGTLGHWFQLGIKTHTTDLVISQVELGGHTDVLAQADSGRLQVHTLSFEMLMECSVWIMDKSDLEIQDASVYRLAREIGAILLTGDKDLRHYTESEHIEVHGTLWIFDQLVKSGLLKPKDAANKLESLLNQGRRLPKKESQNRIAKWRKIN